MNGGSDVKVASWTGVLTLIVLLVVPLVGYLAHENAQVQVNTAEINELRIEMSDYRAQTNIMSNQLATISQKLSDISDSLKARPK